MISFNLLKKNINNFLKKYYPIKNNFNNISNLSHFYIKSSNWNKYLPFNFNLDGIILNGKYKNYNITHIITSEKYTFKKFIKLYVSLLNNSYNPCVNQNKFLIFMHIYNNIDILNINNIIIKKENDIVNIPIIYLSNPTYNIYWNNTIQNKKIYKDNHFYFNSFDVYSNKDQIRSELLKLFLNRDKYNSIHFYLDNNGGGDIVPAHLILRCLIPQKEKWMKNIKKILTNKNILEWDCWKEEDINSPNYDVVKYLDLGFLPEYKTKYNGKIYLHMNNQNRSAAWFFITYLIYGFSKNIERFSKKCYGKSIKFGRIVKESKLILKGISGTTSGDGNSIEINYNNININIPTEQFIDCSIKKYDWNRYWIE
jgi:hypothetical protein